MLVFARPHNAEEVLAIRQSGQARSPAYANISLLSSLCKAEKHLHTDKQAEQRRHQASCASQLLKLAQASIATIAIHPNSTSRHAIAELGPFRH